MNERLFLYVWGWVMGGEMEDQEEDNVKLEGR